MSVLELLEGEISNTDHGGAGNQPRTLPDNKHTSVTIRAIHETQGMRRLSQAAFLTL